MGEETMTIVKRRTVCASSKARDLDNLHIGLHCKQPPHLVCN